MENTNNNTIKVSEVALSILNADNSLSVNVLSDIQREFVNSVDENEKPVAEKLCVYANTKDCVDVDFYFTLYVFHIQRFEKSQCSIKSTLEAIPDIFGIDLKADEENTRKLFKAFGRFFTSPENRKFFTRFGVTKLRVLSLVHDGKTDKLFDLIKTGTVNPFMTVASLKEIVKNINKSGTLSIDLDYKDNSKKSSKKNPVSKPDSTEQTESNQTESNQTESEQTENPVSKPDSTEQTESEQTETEQTATHNDEKSTKTPSEVTNNNSLEYNVEIEKIRQIVNRIIPNNGIEKVITDILSCFPTVNKYTYKRTAKNDGIGKASK